MFHRQWLELRRENRERRRVQNYPEQSPEDSKRNNHAAPINAALANDIATRQENGEKDQDRDRSNINKNLDQAAELGAQQEKVRCDTDKYDYQTKGSMDQFGKCRGGERTSDRNNSYHDKGRGIHAITRCFTQEGCRAGALPAESDRAASGALALQYLVRAGLFIQRNDRCAGQTSFSSPAKGTA